MTNLNENEFNNVCINKGYTYSDFLDEREAIRDAAIENLKEKAIGKYIKQLKNKSGTNDLISLYDSQDQLPTFFVDMYASKEKIRNAEFDLYSNCIAQGIIYNIHDLVKHFSEVFEYILTTEFFVPSIIIDGNETDIRFLPNCKILSNAEKTDFSLFPSCMSLPISDSEVFTVILLPPFCPTPFTDSHIFGCYYLDEDYKIIGLKAVRLLDLKYYNGNPDQMLTYIGQLIPEFEACFG